MMSAFGVDHGVSKGLPSALRPKTGLGFKSDYAHLRRTSHLLGQSRAQKIASGSPVKNPEKLGAEYREASRKYLLKRTKKVG